MGCMTQRGLRIAASLMTAGPYASFELSDHARRIETAASIHEWTVVTMLSQRAKSPDERAAVAAVLEKLEAGELDGLVFASSFAAIRPIRMLPSVSVAICVRTLRSQPKPAVTAAFVNRSYSVSL